MDSGQEEYDRHRRREGMEQKALQTAKKMLEDNLPIETIIKYTDLKKEEILALKSS